MEFAALVLMSSGGEVGAIAQTFGVDWPHLIAQIISFCIVCILLHRFAYKPVLNMLSQRRQQIAQSLADSEKIKADLARNELDRQQLLAKANAQASQLIDEAHAAAARVQQVETQNAIREAEQIVIKAREAAGQERALMLAELKGEVGRLVVQTTATVAGKVLTDDDQRRLAEETEKQLATA
ncbi:MAG TPA: F0F1 ATP synthase subunit B [Blastocatellia bacterium]|nr:F0F1 ATP synthase subunit B [Blastocatellia bacterium]